jgi:hypothetical protein
MTRKLQLHVVGADSDKQPATTAEDEDISSLWIDTESDPLAADPPAKKPDAAKKALPLPYNGSRLFNPVYLDQLTDRRWDVFYPSILRLYHYLKIKSRRGTRTVRLTNEMAAEIGISRSHKSERLKELEALGLIEVTRNGLKTPEVRTLAPPMARIVRVFEAAD